MQSALQDEIETLRRHYRSDRDPAGLVFASLADAYRRAGELDEAWSVLEEGLSEHPDFTTGHLVAARVHRDRGELEDASEKYTRVLELDPENTAALREMAALAQDEGRIEEALSLCQRLALLEPTDPDLRARIRELKEVHFRAVTGSGEEGEEEAVAVDEGGELESAFAEPSEEGELEAPPVDSSEDEGPDGVSGDEAGTEDAWEDDAWYEGLPIPESAAAPPDEAEESAPEPQTPGEGPSPVDEENEEEEETEAEVHAEADDGGVPEPAVYTRTMADLYARQGHVERALEVYGRLLEQDPDDEDLRERIRELNEGAEAAADDGPTIGSYFESLLAWEREE